MLSIVIPTRRPDNLRYCLDAIDRHTRNYEVVLVDREGGIAEKINEGIRKAKGDHIVLLHDDCEVTSGWADELADVGCFKVGEMGDLFECWGGFYPGDYCKNPQLHPDYCFFLCLSKEVAKKVIPFDEKFTKPYYQDVDMGLHLKSKGYKIKCLPGKIKHLVAEGAGVVVPEQKEYLDKKWGKC